MHLLSRPYLSECLPFSFKPFTTTCLLTQLLSSSRELEGGSGRSVQYRNTRHSLTAYQLDPCVSSFSLVHIVTRPFQRIIGFMDPSSSAQSPGWPLLNILAYLYHHYPETKSHRVLCWRDTIPPSSASWRSRFGVFQVGAKCEPGKRPTAVGWERTAQNKLAPRVADLGATMDPLQLADQALSLNLKLMRWRILPALDLEKVSSTKCLLLGAGTLGCYVARTLLAWGVRKITLVDSGKVSFSNPVRQPLFEFEDCLEGGKPKAECAANRLKNIFPGVVSAHPS